MRLNRNLSQSQSLQKKVVMYQRQWSQNPRSMPDMSWLVDKITNQDVHILGGGASLHGIDWSWFDDKVTLCINNTIKYYPRPTAHVFLDMPVLMQGGQTPGVPIITKYGNAVREPCFNVPVTNSFDPSGMKGFYSPFSTAHVCLSIAVAYKAKRIIVWGMEQKHYTEQDAIEHHQHIQGSGQYKDKDFLSHFKSVKNFGHFYSKDMPHQRDHIDRSYVNAGLKMNVFKEFNIYTTAKVHNTPFTTIPWSEL
jgi:hypothetical protein